MAYLKELIDRLGKALGFTHVSPKAESDSAPAQAAGMTNPAAPENET